MMRLAAGAVAAVVLAASCSATSQPRPRPSGPPPVLLSTTVPTQPITPPEAVRLALPPVAPDRALAAPQSIDVDHTIEFSEWESAASFTVSGHELIETIAFTLDDHHLYARIDYRRDLLGDDAAGWDLYVEVPNASAKERRSLLGHELGFAASHVVSWRGSDPLAPVGPTPLATAATTGVALGPEGHVVVGFDGRSQVLELPLADFGPVRSGDWLRFRFVDRSGGAEGAFAPEGPMHLPLPITLTSRPCLTPEAPCGAGPS